MYYYIYEKISKEEPLVTAGFDTAIPHVPVGRQPLSRCAQESNRMAGAGIGKRPSIISQQFLKKSEQSCSVCRLPLSLLRGTKPLRMPLHAEYRQMIVA